MLKISLKLKPQKSYTYSIKNVKKLNTTKYLTKFLILTSIFNRVNCILGSRLVRYPTPLSLSLSLFPSLSLSLSVYQNNKYLNLTKKYSLFANFFILQQLSKLLAILKLLIFNSFDIAKIRYTY